MFKKIVLALDRVIEKVGDWGLLSSGVIILIMGFLSTYAVFRRYVLHNPEFYSYELSTIFLTACAVLAVAGLQRYKRHLRVDFITNYLSPRTQGIFIDVITPILGLFYVVIIVWQSWSNATYSMSIGELSQSAWQEPLWPSKFVVPICMFWLLLVLVAQLIRGLIAIFRKEEQKA